MFRSFSVLLAIRTAAMAVTPSTANAQFDGRFQRIQATFPNIKIPNRGSGSFKKNSSTYRGSYQADRRGNYNVNGSVTNGNRSIGGGINRNRNGNVSVNGQFVRPGTIPGTREHWNGGVDFRGRRSQARMGLDVYVGGNRIASGTSRIDGRGYHQRSSGRIGPARAQQSMGIQFRGRNSSANFSQSGRLGGIGSSQQFQVGRNGASGSVGVKVGGYRMGVSGSVGRNGTSFRIQPPKVSLPQVNTPRVRIPRIQTPKLTMPRIAAPKVKLPKFKSPF